MNLSARQHACTQHTTPSTKKLYTLFYELESKKLLSLGAARASANPTAAA
jgi:hypothetical protein